MMSSQLIRNIADVAAYRAAEEGKVPLPIWGKRDVPNIPFLGDYIPAGYRQATWDELPKAYATRYWEPGTRMIDVTVDASDPGEAEALLCAGDGQYWAMSEQGQFQVVVRAYIKDDEARGVPAPDEASVTCEVCGIIHDDMEECDPNEGDVDCHCEECRPENNPLFDLDDDDVDPYFGDEALGERDAPSIEDERSYEAERADREVGL